MKVLHVILGKADKNRPNGVNQVIAGLATHTARLGVPVSVLGLAKSAAHEGELVARDGFEVEVYSRPGPAFRAALRKAVGAADIVHLHGTYSRLNLRVGRLCAELKTPYVVTLHGGLSPARNTWRNAWKKDLFHMLFQKRHLERAALIHALTEEESTEALERFRPAAMTVIPNGVDLSDFPAPATNRAQNRPIQLGYIGRISREKNLDALCEAFAQVNGAGDAQLLLAGPDSPESAAILRRWSAHGVGFVGPKFGDDKRAFLAGLDLFVHPSRADVFSIGAMEALASGVPLVISRTSDASHFAGTGAFILCEPTAFGIARALRRAFNCQAGWPEMARRGRQLVESRLNWNAAATDLMAAYKNVLER
ncbi:glycosyltransferase [Thioclava electrotropha]|uniref:Glycosyltransferase n=1 Tax=Thioclava electrotropha TaxID=1549850 RepID=A0ABX6YQA9_9RHOB|nr:glycosyltransferase [Thioclava electrotropha]QPZ90007.1 glycosyltransferase [Thioclava electrotropha]